MNRRLKLLGSVQARDLGSYREKYERGETKTVVADSGAVTVEALEPLPHIVIVIDEMADLMMAHGKEVEALVVRLAQMSRAVGIHLILATQRPSVEVVTGLIKANVPARIAFFVTNQIDSRTILDTSGAEKLLGKGDMLYSPPGVAQPKRLQGVFISEDEVKRVVKFWKEQKEDLGEEEIGGDFDGGGTKDADVAGSLAGDDFSKALENGDPTYEAAKKVVIETGRAATTFLQRRLSIGYGKAAKYLDQMEEEGIVGTPDGPNKGRRVLVGKKAGISEEPTFDDPIADQAARDKWRV
jgi:S-DNA-T family DNA segregation ATPase FtsK/SpoIIIE